MTLIAPGTCRYCGCKGDHCTTKDGDLCFFTDRERTVCSGEGCQRAHQEWLQRIHVNQLRMESARRQKARARRKGRAI